MEKRLICITGYELEIIKNGLNTGSQGSINFLKAIFGHIQDRKHVPLEYYPDGITKKDLVESMNLDTRNIDYALPQHIVDEVRDKTGYEMTSDFVFKCSSDYWGPVPITDFGRRVLPIIAHILRFDITWVMDNVIDPKI